MIDEFVECKFAEKAESDDLGIIEILGNTFNGVAAGKAYSPDLMSYSEDVMKNKFRQMIYGQDIASNLSKEELKEYSEKFIGLIIASTFGDKVILTEEEFKFFKKYAGMTPKQFIESTNRRIDKLNVSVDLKL